AAAAAAAATVMPPGSAAATGALPAPPALGGAAAGGSAGAVKASPLGRKIAEQHGVDIARARTPPGPIEDADGPALVERQGGSGNGGQGRLVAASPKARRLAAERGLDLGALRGTGPGGAVLVTDLPAARVAAASAIPTTPLEDARPVSAPRVGTIWRIMAQRMTASWTAAPPFDLVREVHVSRLVSWLDRARKQAGARITYSDLLIKLVAAALIRHPRVNVSWRDGAIAQHAEVNIGLAVAIDDGLVVPVIHRADT